MATTANWKAVHYEHELQAALCRGAWGESQPGKTPKGVPVSWNELLRKYTKHCKSADVSEVARSTREISLLLCATPVSTSFAKEAFDHDCAKYEDALGNRDEYLLDDQRVEEAKAALKVLDELGEKRSSNPSVLLIKGYYHFALRETRKALEVLSSVDYDGPTAISTTNTEGTLSAPGSAFSSFGTSSGLTTLEALSRSGTIAGSVGVTELSKRLEGEVGEGKVWAVVERIRGRCIQGMAFERLQDFKSALTAYDAGVALLDRLAISRMAPQGRQKVDLFSKYRELWRWAESILRAALLLEARTRSKTQALRFLRLYGIYSCHWIPVFRPLSRSAIYTLHIRALCLSPPGSETSYTKRTWREEGRRVASELKALLEVTTKFPRAGEVNHRVLDFVDLCMALWEKGGASEAEAGWIIDILWWSTRLTFHSHRIMRHLSRLLFVRDDITTARRSFRLYVNLVTKDRQTAAGDVSLQLKRRPKDGPPAHPSAISVDVADEEGVDEEDLRGSGIDADSDRTFVQHLVWGISMLARIAKTYEDAKEVEEFAALAQAAIDSGTLGANRALVAKVKRAEGISQTLLSHKDLDARLRVTHQLAALEALKAAAELNPKSASTFYHLAIAQAESREVDEAILSARSAVEKDPSQIRAWHLLGLLLTAQGDWKGAQAVFDLGAAQAEELEGLSDDESPPVDGMPNAEGLTVRDFVPNGDGLTAVVADPPAVSAAAPADMANGDTPSEPLLPTTLLLPPSRSLQLPQPDIPLLTQMDHFEAALQLLITQLALTELVDGAEVANVKWPEVFSYFSEHCPSSIGHHHPPAAPRTEGSTSATNPSIRDSLQRSEAAAAPASDLRGSSDGAQSLDAPRLGVVVPPSPGPGDQPDGSGSRTSAESPTNGTNKNLPKRILKGGQRQMHSLGRRVTHEAKRLDDFMDGSMKGLNRKLHKSTSAPNLRGHKLQNRSSTISSTMYQASSIHSRRGFRVKSLRLKGIPSSLDVDEDEIRAVSPPPPLPPPATPASKRPLRETRLLSDLWLTSAAMFRRMGKLEQAKAAIQEAEVLDEGNPGVWVQLGLHHSASGHHLLAVESLHKALVIEQDHIAALVHLAQEYLKPGASSDTPAKGNIDLAAGLLTGLTQGQGWDVAEAWYFLAKACGLQKRKERERECLIYALKLQETKPIRPIGIAVPRCL